MRSVILIVIIASLSVACKTQNQVQATNTRTPSETVMRPQKNETFLTQYISKVESGLTLNGKGDEQDWDKAKWRAMNQLMLGPMPSKEDFNGRYKLLWDENMIYLLAEIQDDIYMDTHSNGLEKYWDDDCLEIFIDEDKSGGEHTYSYNAFAYHISLDDKVVDIDDRRKANYYNDHMDVAKVRKGNMITWEIGIKVYSDRFSMEDPESSRIKLSPKKQLGFMVAYCDNDTSEEREHFMGDMFIEGEDKNQGWINASVFGSLYLKQ